MRDVFGWAVGELEVAEDLLVILVVEDDPLIQILAEEQLTDGGFELAIATSGEEAVTLLKGGNTKYRALVTDINLQGKMDGWEVGKQAREIDPAFPVIYMTGAAADQWASHGVPNSILLTKPFAPAQLVTAISQLLNGAQPPM
jgi:CheY-like chemotaxis protein